MAIEGFDYKGFATSMAEQAKDLAPKELKDFEKEYIVKTLGNFTMLAGEALYNDESLNITADQAIFITQIIAEWSFHKSVDLIHSGILPEYWDSIMQKIAFTIFEIAKIAITKNLPKEQLLQAVEFHVVKVYKESIEELQKRGIIDEEIKKRAESQSNIDDMAQVAQAEAQQQAQQQAQAQQNDPEAQARKKAMIEESERNRKEAEKKRKEKQEAQKNMPALPKFGKTITHNDLKLMTLAVVLKVLSQAKVTTILDKFNPRDSKTITGYMNIANLESQVDGDLIADCIKEIKGCLPIKRKLTKENVILDIIDLYKAYPRERVEKTVKRERPIVKRFISQAYDGEFGELPLRVAGIVTDYIKENI